MGAASGSEPGAPRGPPRTRLPLGCEPRRGTDGQRDFDRFLHVGSVCCFYNLSLDIYHFVSVMNGLFASCPVLGNCGYQKKKTFFNILDPTTLPILLLNIVDF